MKSFQSRNPVPIAVVGVVLMLLGTVAALNSDDLPIIGAGTTYTANFSEAAGLQPDDEVRIAGVKVGQVTDVELAGDRVHVSFKVKDAWLGDRTTAAIKIKTLLGQKYVALDPVGENALDPGDTIPRERTMSPFDVLEAFRGLSSTVDQIDTDQLAQSMDVLSETFSETPDELRGALNGLSRLSDTIASRDRQLAELLSNTRRVSQTLANRDQELVKLIEDGNLLLDELRRRQDAISAMLDGTRRLATELQGLVNDNKNTIGPVLAQLDKLTGMLERNQEALALGIKRYAPFVRVFTNTIGNGRWFDNYICGLLLPSAGVAGQGINEQGCNVK